MPRKSPCCSVRRASDLVQTPQASGDSSDPSSAASHEISVAMPTPKEQIVFLYILPGREGPVARLGVLIWGQMDTADLPRLEKLARLIEVALAG